MWRHAMPCHAVPCHGIPPPPLSRLQVRVHVGRVFVWFDAEGRPPQWELQCHRDVEVRHGMASHRIAFPARGDYAMQAGLASGGYYLGATAQLEFGMHVCEMHMNSADPHHFNTLHAATPIAGRCSMLLRGRTFSNMDALRTAGAAAREHPPRITLPDTPRGNRRPCISRGYRP